MENQLSHQDWDPIYLRGNKELNKKEANQNTGKSKEQKIDEKIEGGDFSFKMMDSSYGKHIQQCRCSKGWSQKDLAQKLNVSVKEITEIENGKAKHNGRLMSRLNNLFQQKTSKNIKKKHQKK